MRPPSRFEGAQVTKYLLIINIAVFFIDYFFLASPSGGLPPLVRNGAFILSEDGLQQPWGILTYQFLHGSLMHLLTNMLGLFFFGPIVERWWGSNRFLAFYLICGCIGAVVYSLLALVGILGPLGGILIGASGSLFGILISAAIISPHEKIILFPIPIPMRLRTLVIAVLAISVFTILFGGDNPGGEACHLGGAIGGFLLMRYPDLLSYFQPRITRPQRSARKRTRPYRPQTPPKLRPRPEMPASDAEIDAILDKVGEQGLQSLTEREKDILRRAAGK